jgi:small ligand-binding sensory domain FIST
MKAEAAIATGPDWRDALAQAAGQLPMLAGADPVDLTLLFASDAYAPEFDDLLTEVRLLTGGGALLGCSGQGIIGTGKEVEQEPALSLQVFSLPGVELTAARLEPEDVGHPGAVESWSKRFDARESEDFNAWLFFVDPFSTNGDHVVELLASGDKNVPLIGGLASGDYRRRATYVFLNDQVFRNGATGIAIGGAYTVKTIVSQGAMPIGRPWTITDVRGNHVETIGMRPALDILTETFEALSPDMQQRAQRNLLVGLAIDEYQDELQRGDFLIRNLVAIDQQSGSIAIGAYPRIGQTIQFQLRDPIAADEELKEMLLRTQMDLGDQQPVGALLCSCNGRGVGLFGEPNHDAQALLERFGAIPTAGFFCNGEIGPVGSKNFVHGFTASIALIVPVTPKP